MYLNSRSLTGAGNVLLPIHAARRMLEVALLLDKHWEHAKLHFTLVLAAPHPTLGSMNCY